MNNRPILPGSIIYAEVPDPQGRNLKTRPLIVLAPPDAPGGVCVAVFVTTTPPDPDTAEACVELRWDPRPGGHRITKLTRCSFAFCPYTPEVPASEVQDVRGEAPRDQFLRILEIINRLRSL